jgi:hypothetical protein
MMIRFTYCKNFASAETREAEWNPFATALSTFKAFPSKEASVKRAAFVGGVRADEDKGRADGNIVLRTVATLDFDAPQGSLADIEFQLGMTLPGAFVAYSTFRHTPEVPRFRLCVPLSRPVNEDDYKVIVNDIVRLVDLGDVDPCSFTMSQLMFLPSNRQGVTPWSLRQDGEPWAVNRTEIAITVGGEDDDFSDLEAMVAAEPLGMDLAEIDALLENYPAEGKDYDEWVRVGMALFHEFRGSEDGWDRWATWSALSSKHDARQMRTKWRSFGGAARPVTMASIIKLSGGRRAAVEIQPTGSTYVALEAEARSLRSLEGYTALRNKVSALGEVQLRADMRMMLAGFAYDTFGKGAGMTKGVINKAFKPAKASGRSVEGADGSAPFDGPSWLADWVYCEADATFDMVSTRHSIKREAFRAKFDRMPEVLAGDVADAASFALTYCRIPTVASKMFWPGFAPIFTDANTGLTYLNTYERSGAEPCGEIDEAGKKIMNRFMAHLSLMVGVEAERQIILDFMAYVYQNPGKRVQWALLIKGIEGNGKTYFFRVMERLMGKQTSVVTTLAIESNFTSWAEGSVLACVEEIYIQGLNKYAILNKLKPMITNDQIAVMSKNKNERTVPNFTSYMMFTNHADAIPVGDNDRRYCVISTRQTRKEDLFNELGGGAGLKAYFDQLFDDLNTRPDVFARFFTDYKVSGDFSATGRAPETEGLADMKSMHVSEDRDNVESAIEKYAREDVISQDIVDVTYLNRMARMDGIDMPQTSRLAHILSDMGLVQIEGRNCKINKVEDKHIVWYRRGALSPSGEAMTSDLVKKLVRAAFNSDKDFTDAPF